MAAEVTARAIITIGAHVLLAQGKGETYFHLPGGHVEAGEAPAQALTRELREELAREVALLTPVTVLRNQFDKDGQRVEELMHVYTAKLYPVLQEVPPQSQESWLTFQWVPIQDLARVKLLPPALIPLIALYGGA